MAQSRDVFAGDVVASLSVAAFSGHSSLSSSWVDVDVSTFLTMVFSQLTPQRWDLTSENQKRWCS